MRHIFGASASMSIASVAERLIRQDMVDKGVKKPLARKMLADDAQLAPGTLANLARGRLKRLDGVAAALNRIVIERLATKIRQLECELEIARITASRPDETDLFAAMDALEKAKKLLRKE